MASRKAGYCKEIFEDPARGAPVRALQGGEVREKPFGGSCFRGFARPELDGRPVHLGMKLKSVTMSPEAKRLARTCRGKCKELGPFGRGKAVVVPLEADEFCRHICEKRVPLPRRGKVHRQGPLFAAGIGGNRSSQDVRQELPAETDAEEGNGSGSALPDELLDRHEERVPGGV